MQTRKGCQSYLLNYQILYHQQCFCCLAYTLFMLICVMSIWYDTLNWQDSDFITLNKQLVTNPCCNFHMFCPEGVANLYEAVSNSGSTHPTCNQVLCDYHCLGSDVTVSIMQSVIGCKTKKCSIDLTKRACCLKSESLQQRWCTNELWSVVPGMATSTMFSSACSPGTKQSKHHDSCQHPNRQSSVIAKSEWPLQNFNVSQNGPCKIVHQSERPANSSTYLWFLAFFTAALLAWLLLLAVSSSSSDASPVPELPLAGLWS